MQVTTNRRIEIEIQLTYLPNVYCFFFVVGSQYSCSFTKVGVALVRVSIHTASKNFDWDQILPHVRESAFRNPGSFCLMNLEYSSRNPESNFRWQKSGIQYLKSGIHGLESTAWNPESKTVLDFLLHGAKNFLRFVFAVRKREKKFIISSCKGNYIV